MRPLDRPGTFKARAFEWSVQSLPSGDPIIRVMFECEQERDGEGWRNVEHRAVRGDFFLVKKTGAANDNVVEMLCRYLGWNGAFTDMGQPADTLLQVDVESNDYKNKTYFQVKWIRGENEDRSGGTVSADKLAELDKRFGNEMQAMAKRFAQTSPEGPGKTTPDYGDIPFQILFALPLLGAFL